MPAKIAHQDGLWTVTLGGVASQPHREPWAIAWMHKVWPYGEAIAESEYDYLVQYLEWALKHDPENPVVRPHDPIDVTKLPPIF